MSKVSEILYELALSMDESYEACEFTEQSPNSSRSSYICDNLNPRLCTPNWSGVKVYSEHDLNCARDFLFDLGMGSGFKVFCDAYGSLEAQWRAVPLRVTFLIFASELAHEWKV